MEKLFENIEESIQQSIEAPPLKAGALARARRDNAIEKDFKYGNPLVGKDGKIQSTF